MLTPLKLATYTGELAKWNNWQPALSIQALLVNPIELTRIESRFEKRKAYKPKTIKITNIETGVEFESIEELGEILALNRNAMYNKINIGKHIGYVNIATQKFIAPKKLTASIKAELMEQGYIFAHFKKG